MRGFVSTVKEAERLRRQNSLLISVLLYLRIFFGCEFCGKQFCFLVKLMQRTISHMSQNVLKLELNFVKFLYFVKFILRVSQQH
jgi:hypothetical protein